MSRSDGQTLEMQRGRRDVVATEPRIEHQELDGGIVAVALLIDHGDCIRFIVVGNRKILEVKHTEEKSKGDATLDARIFVDFVRDAAHLCLGGLRSAH